MYTLGYRRQTIQSIGCVCYYHFSYVCDSLTEDVGISSSQRHLCHIQNRHGYTKDNDEEEEKNKTKFEQNSTLWKLLSRPCMHRGFPSLPFALTQCGCIYRDRAGAGPLSLFIDTFSCCSVV